MAIPTLSGSYIDQTYQRLVQTDATRTQFADGLGNPITFGTTPTSSLLVTASAAGNIITFTKGDGSTFPISVSGTGSTYNTATGSYGSFYDTGSVIATSATAIYSMSLSTTDISNGVSISGSTNPYNTFIKVANAGVYNLQFSAQFSNSDNSIQDVVIWVRKNGTNIADSSGMVGVPPFKAGSNGQVIASWNYFLDLSANDYVQLCWHVEQANVITLETIAAGTNPTHPRTPSLIVTAQRVDTFLSNTGSFTGSFSGTHTGSLFGTSSWATNATNATTSSYPFTITGSSLRSVYSSNPSGIAASTTSSIYIGQNAGNSSINSSKCVYIGLNAGLSATNAGSSIFIGDSAGNSAANANSAIFIGPSSGFNANSSQGSVFIGQFAGGNASNTAYSNFIGFNAGEGASGANHSNFLGRQSGNYAANAAFSTLIGYNVGADELFSGGIGSNNIIIGTNITLPDNTKDSINLGGIIFATGSYSNAVTQSSIAVSNAKVGINNSLPEYNLDVLGSGNYTNNLTVTGSLIVNGNFRLNGNLELSYLYVDLINTGNYVITDIAPRIGVFRFANTDSTAYNVELPPASIYPNRVYSISRGFDAAYSGGINISCNSDMEIKDGSFSANISLDIRTRYQWISNGTQWILMMYSST